jgi:hypothetical protein
MYTFSSVTVKTLKEKKKKMKRKGEKKCECIWKEYDKKWQTEKPHRTKCESN